MARRHLRGRRLRRLRPARATTTSTCTSRSRSTGDRLIVDFDGSDDRPEIQAWSTFGNTRGYIDRPARVSLVDPSIPKNEGFFDCIDLRVAAGSCVNPAEGKPVRAARTIPASRSAT